MEMLRSAEGNQLYESRSPLISERPPSSASQPSSYKHGKKPSVTLWAPEPYPSTDYIRVQLCFENEKADAKTVETLSGIIWLNLFV